MIVSDSFIKTWFALQRRLIAGLQVAYVDLHGAGVRSGGLVVTYPDGLDRSDEFALAARLAQRSGTPVISSGVAADDGAETLRIAYPLQLGRHADGAVVVEVNAPLERQAAVVRLLKYGEAWLNLALAQSDDGADPAGGYAAMVEAGMRQHDYRDALTALLAMLPEQVRCTRVALGRLAGRQVALEAVSEQAELDRHGARAKLLERAMHEALQFKETLCWPDPSADAGAASAQRELVDSAGLSGVCTVPLIDGLRAPLVFCFEFADGGWQQAEARRAGEQAARIAAPVLELRRELSRPWWRRLAALGGQGVQQLLARPGYRRRLLMATAALSLALLAMTRGEYRVSAPATLEGAVQRAVVAPFDGYVVEAEVRAGQEVAQGRLLARLDDRELLGERRKLRAEQAELAEQHRQAVATLDHAEAKVLEAQLEQTGARLALLQDQLTRTELRAPLDGLVISGDWSRALGVPVSRGDLMFQIAPLNEYRVAIQVSDRDIAGLASGQQGELTLAALPRQRVRFAVTHISPMAPEEAGEPVFRVEADLIDSLPALRPGMQGVAKVTVGERRRWWIWTHALTDWLDLQFWRLRP